MPQAFVDAGFGLSASNYRSSNRGVAGLVARMLGCCYLVTTGLEPVAALDLLSTWVCAHGMLSRLRLFRIAGRSLTLLPSIQAALAPNDPLLVLF